MNTGNIVQVVGPVVDVVFGEKLPGIYNALTVEYKLQDQPVKLTLEVQQHMGDKWVRAISMSGTEGSSAVTKWSIRARPFPCPSAKE
jgi:F-type H+-transporting ATPase subunit beta